MKKDKLNVVPTDISKIKGNTIWCPTLQLIWNDLKYVTGVKNIVFINDEDNVTVKELNQESFSKNMISNEYYYKNYGYMTFDLKNKIENDIEKLFNEKSDILDKFSFSKESQDYFFYSILIRKFSFENPFDILSDNTFGINENSDEKLKNNIRVLFVDNDGYAIKLLAKNNDEIILYKGMTKENFSEIYKLICEKNEEKELNSDDTITISNLDFKVEFKYQELSNKIFYDKNLTLNRISDNLQTISFKLDNEGGKLKSEAGMSVRYACITHGRHFDFTNNFVLFFKEKNKDKPYFAINIDNINNFR